MHLLYEISFAFLDYIARITSCNNYSLSGYAYRRKHEYGGELKSMLIR